MALWLVRGGRHGEYEQKFLDDNCVYLTWWGLNHDLSAIDCKEELRAVLTNTYPAASDGRISNNLGQIWAFSHRIAPKDWVALPSKHKAAIHIGQVTGCYEFHPDAVDPYYHSLAVDWIATDIPRSNFDQDILYSFGAFMTVCQVKRNDAERRVRSMQERAWTGSEPLSSGDISGVTGAEPEDTAQEATDLEQAARDQIAKYISARFKGHAMARLIDAVLQAQGYTTHVSAPGPDKGIDILAAPGPLGFGQPRICVQVKSGDAPLDRPMLDQLVGVMQNVQADQGLLVSWGGFKSSIDKEKASQFFRVRLWDQDMLIEQLLAHYEQLDQTLQAELPLKRIWTLAEAVEE